MRAAAAAPSRRQQSKWQREQHQQHRLYIAIGVLVVVVGGIFAAGLIYDNAIRANDEVARVGPDSITAAQLLGEVRPLARSLDTQAKQYGGGASIAQYIDQQKRSLPDQTLSDVIDRHVIQQEATLREVSVAPAEVDDKERQTVADFQSSANPALTPDAVNTPDSAAVPDSFATPAATAVPTPDAAAAPAVGTTPTVVPTLETSAYGGALQQLLERNNLSEADFRDRLQQSLLREKLQTAIAQEQVPATQEQVHARHILVATPEQANEVLTQLHGGADFATLAAQLSTDPGSKDKGGDLGWFGRGVMDPPFQEAAFALQPGQLSDVVHGANGYHVIQVLERNPARAVPDDQLTTQRQKVFTDWLASRRTSPDVKLQLSQQDRDWILTRIGLRP